MCGDGTNDAPALAQADVGVAMNTGTVAAREAGNMVDLDSNPTKLIEVVEIGKQLLMTRGALTTFSIANDVAKYFAIIPAMFVAFYPQLQALNIMGLATPAERHPVGDHLQRADHHRADPAGAEGRRLPPDRRRPAAAPQPADLRPRRHHRPVHRHQGHRPRRHGPAPRLRRTVMLKEIRPAIVLLVALTLITGLVYPLAMTGLAQVLFPRQANGSLIEKDGKVVGSALIGQVFADDKYFHGRPSATNAPDPKDADQDGRRALQRRQLRRLEPRPDQQGADRPRQGRRRQARRRRTPRLPVPIDLVTTSGSGLDPHISPEAALFQVPRVAKARNMPEDRVRQLVDQNIEGRTLGLLGEPRVNVLALNLALDKAAPQKQ